MASAWPDDDIPLDLLKDTIFTKTNSDTDRTTNGLLLGIQKSTDLNEIIRLIGELFDFKRIELYRGIKQTEAYFIVSQNGK